MAWPYYTANQTHKLLANFKLSEEDKLFIGTLYPSSKQVFYSKQIAWIDPQYYKWNDDTKTSLSITDLDRQQEYHPDVSDGKQLTSAKRMIAQASKLKTDPIVTVEILTISMQCFMVIRH